MEVDKNLSPGEYFVYKEDGNGDVDITTCPAIVRANDLRQSVKEELVGYSIFDPKQKDPLRKQVDEILSKKAKTFEEDRAFGSMLGMVVGDALGAPMEFKRVQYGVISITDMVPATSFSLQAGQWTDDASMGLCIADSLLKFPNFCPSDLKLRFFNWWTYGYNNAFRFDEKRLYKGSVGLGVNISMNLSEFQRKGTTFTKAGDKNTSGNGSVMRMGAVTVRFHDDYLKCLEVAEKQSLLTHQGEEAAECCRLMAHLIYTAIHGDGTVKSLLTLISFDTKLPSVQSLIQSASDSDFNWKAKDFKYNSKRAIEQPTYIGSYCMDAVAMALHCIWTTDTFASAMLKSANMAGDADSVTAVCGQIAGAIYGLSSFPKGWLEKVHKWDNKDTLLKAYKLYHKQ